MQTHAQAITETGVAPRTTPVVGLVNLPTAATLEEEILNTGRLLSAFGFTEDVRPRNAQVFFERFGGLGASESKMQSIGERHGMSRERVRQIVEKQLQWLGLAQLGSERFDAFAAACDAMRSAPVAQIEQRLRPILGDTLSIEGAIEYGKTVLGRSVELKDDQLPPIYAQLASITRRLTRHSGAAHVTLAWALCMRESKTYIDLDEFRSNAERMEGFQWIDSGKSWFWLGPWAGGNKILDRAMDILHAARRPLDIEIIYNGITRQTRAIDSEIKELAGTLPPIDIVTQILLKCPAFVCQRGDDFKLADDHSEWSLASESAKDIVDYLRQQGGVASHAELRRDLVDGRGMGLATMNFTLAMHPTIQPVDHGIWSLRGTPVAADRLRQICEDMGRRTKARSLAKKALAHD